MSKMSLSVTRQRLFASTLVLISPLFLAACVDKNHTDQPSNIPSETSCSEPIIIPYHSNEKGIELSWFEKSDLLMSATGLIPASENGQACREDPSIEQFRLSPPNETSTILRHFKFERQDGPKPPKTLEQSIFAQKTIDLIRDGECEQAWDFLTPYIVEGSSEAAGVLWAASANIFSTGKPGENNGIIATGMEEFGVTGRGLELSLANASLPVGSSDIYTGIDEIRLRSGRFMNIQLEEFSAKTRCDFERPSAECRSLAIKEDEVERLDTYLKFLTEKDDEKHITCNRRI